MVFPKDLDIFMPFSSKLAPELKHLGKELFHLFRKTEAWMNETSLDVDLAFQIQVSKSIIRTILTFFQNECMSRATIKPNIKNVIHLFIVNRIYVPSKKRSLAFSRYHASAPSLSNAFAILSTASFFKRKSLSVGDAPFS